MLEIYFSASKMLGHLRRGPCGPYLARKIHGWLADVAQAVEMS